MGFNIFFGSADNENKTIKIFFILVIIRLPGPSKLSGLR